ncbi:YbfB/YjiJ family MFS transporter [Nonomuraea purpurea]|uniref:YbfB/YjiJ family MFS transporter n=1 Tax=Nonomuraea purpurea TaxID=1849276 RepID=A0ABV8GNP8_9ACTN
MNRSLILGGAAVIGVTFGLARYGYGLFEPDLRREFDLSMSAVGLIGSATYAGYLLALLLVGALVTRFGPRPLVIAGGVSATAGMALVAFAREPVALTAGLILAGTSSGWAWAPYSDAVDRAVPPGRRERAMGIISSGTAFGVVVAGPLALLAQGTGWRMVWLLFAAIALATTVYNARVLPAGAHRPARSGSRVGLRWLARRSAMPLYAMAVAYGLVGSVYWQYAVAAVEDGMGDGRATAPLFWTLVGLAGTAGAFTGHAIGRYGLRRVHTGIFAGLAVAVALLGLAPGSLPAVITSAVLYGPLFMAGSGLLAAASYHLFPERPAIGFSAAVAFLAVGTIAGPATLGMVADAYGLRTAFLATAAVAMLALLARPRATNGHTARAAGPTAGRPVRAR